MEGEDLRSLQIYKLHINFIYIHHPINGIVPIFDEMIEGLKNQIGDVKIEHQNDSLRYSGR